MSADLAAIAPVVSKDLVVDVVQDGARLHYALPVALRRAGLLGRVFTDWFVRPGSPEDVASAMARRVSPAIGARLAERRCAGLDGARVVTSPALAFRHVLATRSGVRPAAGFAAESAAMARHVMRHGLQEVDAIAGFARHLHPDLARAARRSGCRVVVDQMIAPAAAEDAALRRAASLWPGWDNGLNAGDPIVRSMEEGCWAQADRITCPSPYVRDCLMAQGIPRERLALVPYPIDAAAWPAVEREGRSGPPVVGFVGAVGLRKGAPIFAAIAQRLKREARFVMVGPVGSDHAARVLGDAGVELTGAVPRGRIAAWLAQFDLLLFPSHCEGSAGAVMEAMVTGLPVVTTPSSGSLVRHGIDGFVESCEDLEALASHVALLAGDGALRRRMGQAARLRALDHGIARYAADLGALFRELSAPQGA